jgi:hypothetical protein
MARPRLESKDPGVNARRQKVREKVQRHRERQQIEDKLPRSPAKASRPSVVAKKKIRRPKVQPPRIPLPTVPAMLDFELPPPRHRTTVTPPVVAAVDLDKEDCEIAEGASSLLQMMRGNLRHPRQKNLPLLKKVHGRKKPRDNAKERIYCARSRLKTKLRLLLKELEATLLQLKDSGFKEQKRGGVARKKFDWQYQFDAYDHSMRTIGQNGYTPDLARIHNIKKLADKKMMVRLSTRAKMLENFVGTRFQRDLQEAAWDLVAKFIAAVPPLKEWAGSSYKVQFSMMTKPGHAVKAHKDSADIAPQYSICLGDYSGGELLTWEKGKCKDSDPIPHLSIDVRNKLLLFDGRLEHAVAPWHGKYRINIALYKHYDVRWTKEEPILETPLLVMDFNEIHRSAY